MRRFVLRPAALTALIGLVYLVVAPPTTDLAAQIHRTALARRDVWLVDFSWFGGHQLPSYSVLSPLLGRWLGVLVLAVVAATVAAWAFERLLALRPPGRAVTVAGWWFAAAVGLLLFTGRVTFVLGLACGLLTVLAVHRGRIPGVPAGAGRTTLGVIGALVTTLASPVAALFLALVGLASALAARTPRDRIGPAATAVTALAAAGALAVAFPGGGSEPFVASALWPALLVLMVVGLVLPREERTLRIGVALYVVAIVLAAVLPTPMGGNATRLAAIVGGPVVLVALAGRRPWALAVLLVPLVYWQLYPPVRDATQAWGDRSAHAGFWRPLTDQLTLRQATDPGRIDVPPTARRGEARWVSPDLPLARGWIRQLDRHRNPIFYPDRHGGPLTAGAYRAWLHDNAIRWVALSDAPSDYASRAVAGLLRSGAVPGLTEVWHDRHWRLWRVDAATPTATWSRPGAAPRTLALGPDRIRLRVPAAGDVLLRIRWSRYLRIVEGRGCLSAAADGWTHVRTTAPGTIAVGVGWWTPGRRSPSPGCGP